MSIDDLYSTLFDPTIVLIDQIVFSPNEESLPFAEIHAFDV